MPRRGRTGLDWAILILLVFLIAGVGAVAGLLLARRPVTVSSSSTSAPRNSTTTTTTTTQTPVAPNVITGSYGHVKGQVITGYLFHYYTADDAYWFNALLTNAGTLPYPCSQLRGYVVTGTGARILAGPATGSGGVACPGDNTMQSGTRNTFTFYAPLNGSGATLVEIEPFGPSVQGMVWNTGPPSATGETGQTGSSP